MDLFALRGLIGFALGHLGSLVGEMLADCRFRGGRGIRVRIL